MDRESGIGPEEARFLRERVRALEMALREEQERGNMLTRRLFRVYNDLAQMRDERNDALRALDDITPPRRAAEEG